MATPITITGSIVGNDGVQLKFSANGQAIASFSVLEKARKFDKTTSEYVDGDASFHRVTAFGKLAENVAESCERMTRVVVTGRLAEREYQTSEGETKRVWQVTADDVAVSLKWDIARVERQEGSSNRPQQNRRPAQQIQDSEIPFLCLSYRFGRVPKLSLLS
jgi:single-strand DNA-binding protein